MQDLSWSWQRFGQLGLGDLYELLALRSAVFVVEQHCVYLDPDGLDRCSWHLLGRDAQGSLLAALRAVDPGRKYAEPSIGRVAVAQPARGTGLGRRLMEEGLRCCAGAWPGLGLRISAQAHLKAFYASLGFESSGPNYLEDGILHVEMFRRPN